MSRNKANDLPPEVLAELMALGARCMREFDGPNGKLFQFWFTRTSSRAILVEIYPNGEGWDMWRQLDADTNSAQVTLDALHVYLADDQ